MGNGIIGNGNGASHHNNGRSRRGVAGSSFSSRHFPTLSIGSNSYFSAPLDQTSPSITRTSSLNLGISNTNLIANTNNNNTNVSGGNGNTSKPGTSSGRATNDVTNSISSHVTFVDNTNGGGNGGPPRSDSPFNHSSYILTIRAGIH
jgi:hypothetical protein